MLLPKAVLNSVTNALTSGAMSSRRSRSGGTLMGENVEPVVKVLSEPSLSHCHVQILAGGSDNANVHIDRFGTAETLDLPLLQHAEQFDLHLRWQLADFIEE